MDLQRFFEHWNLREHPFQAEEARNDAVYNRMLEEAIAHPDFTKIYGDPANPGTTIVFGEKGSGKTAIRLMIQRKLADYNKGRESGLVWVVCFDDQNPMLDRLSRHLKTEDGSVVLGSIRLADHQDAILSLAVTDLIDSALAANDKAEGKRRVKALRQMNPQAKADLSVLALLYDQPRHGQASARWKRLNRMMRTRSGWDRGSHGAFTLILLLIGAAGGVAWRFFEATSWHWYAAAIVGGAGGLFAGVSWLLRKWRHSRLGKQIGREIRVVARDPGVTEQQLWDIKEEHVRSQPIPTKGDQDSRYDLTARFLGVIEALGYASLITLVDRIDEPVLVNGDAKRMKQLVWPMLNNKFLQQESIGVKMLLPIETSQMLLGEDVEFKRQARLDKQNVINPLKWTGATLYDLCSWRFQNCQTSGPANAAPLDSMFEDEVDSEYLIEALDQMHQPRDAFKFLYAVILEHCRNTAGETQEFRISKNTLDFARREQSQRVVDLYRGMS